MANTSKEVKQRYQEAAYIEVGEAYELAGTGFEKLDEEPGAQTSSKKYINDKSSTFLIYQEPSLLFAGSSHISLNLLRL